MQSLFFLNSRLKSRETSRGLKNEGRLAPATELQLLLSFIPALYNTEGSTPQMHRAVARALVLTEDEDESHRMPRLQLMKGALAVL